MNLTLDLQAFPERIYRVIKELLLIYVLFLDTRHNVSILGFLVLDEMEQALVYGNLQLLMVVCILDHLVHSILEVVDGGFVLAN